jgi:hypothetical protein
VIHRPLGAQVDRETGRSLIAKTARSRQGTGALRRRHLGAGAGGADCARQVVDVVRAVVAAPVDEERRRAGHGLRSAPSTSWGIRLAPNAPLPVFAEARHVEPESRSAYDTSGRRAWPTPGAQTRGQQRLDARLERGDPHALPATRYGAARRSLNPSRAAPAPPREQAGRPDQRRDVARAPLCAPTRAASARSPCRRGRSRARRPTARW